MTISGISPAIGADFHHALLNQGSNVVSNLALSGGAQVALRRWLKGRRSGGGVVRIRGWLE